MVMDSQAAHTISICLAAWSQPQLEHLLLVVGMIHFLSTLTQASRDYET